MTALPARCSPETGTNVAFRGAKGDIGCHQTTGTRPDEAISASQVMRGTVDDGRPKCKAVAATNRSCISLIADNWSERSRMARSSGTTVIRGSASTSAKSVATEGMLVLPAATAQHASAKAMTGTCKTLAGSCMTVRALAPRRGLPPRNQISAWASRAYSLAAGGIPLICTMPLGIPEVVEHRVVARISAEGHHPGRWLRPVGLAFLWAWPHQDAFRRFVECDRSAQPKRLRPFVGQLDPVSRLQRGDLHGLIVDCRVSKREAAHASRCAPQSGLWQGQRVLLRCPTALY